MSDRSSHQPTPRAPLEPGSAGDTPVPEGSTPRASAQPDAASGSSRGSHPNDPQLTYISARPPAAALGQSRAAPPLESGGLLEGERLGQFLLQQFIGGGGMGVVFRALDTTLNREVAVKVLSRDQAADEEALRRFRNEAQSAARLNHENIARVHFVGEDRGVHYIVFEFIEGINLRDRVEQHGPLPLAEALSYTYQIALALDHACQRDVIHRDIKPSNVLITPDGKAKLVDMGLARLNQVAQADNDLTASGVTLGTFDYISPEQARDPRSADVRSDLYSLGCSFFYMLTGRPPFPDGTVLQKLLQHQGDHPPDPRSTRPELPIEITWLLTRLLAKNPAQRFQQPAELAVQLAALGDKLGVQLGSSSGSWPRPRRAVDLSRWQQHLPWAVPLAALFLIVPALNYVWTIGEQGQPAGLPVAQRAELAPRPIAKGTPAKAAPPAASHATPSGAAANTSPLPPATASNAVAPRGEAAGEPAVPALPRAPLLERVARSVANLNLDELKARAAAAAEADNRLDPPAAGNAAENGLSGADAPIDRAPQTAGAPDEAGEPPRQGLLIVDPTATGAGYYATLQAACNNAKSGDEIELRFNGRQFEEPISISNMKLSIRAGKNKRPVIVFRPQPNPVKFPPGMVSVAGAGGQLYVSNVHWELDLPRDLHADWTLFETRRAERLHFEQCSFTIRNASLGRTAFHAGVAFFDIKAPPGGGSMAMGNGNGDEAPVTIDLQDCVARGEATFIRDNDLQPLRVHWDNGLLATSERLLVATGGSLLPRQLGQVQIHLHHVTAMLQGGLALFTNSDDAPYQMQAEFHCSGSILASMADPPLLEQRGPNTIDDYQARVQWDGEYNIFDGIDVFWKIVAGSAQPSIEQMNFDKWQEFWAGSSESTTNEPVRWQRLPSSDRPFFSHTPDDYALARDAGANPAVGAAGDRLDAGCLIGRIGALPAEPVDATSSNLPREETSAARLGDGS
ncbi:MAG: protein kinase [Pirellulales bacterium]